MDDQLVEVSGPVIVLADARKREGLTTRHSVFVRVDALLAASATAWAESLSTDGEIMWCVAPTLLPAFVDAVDANVLLPSRQVELAVHAAGLDVAEPLDASVARARRTVSAIVRDARFARGVIAAYDGLCALCGLDFGLVEGAHIYPAAAPGSPDEPWNGLCLCNNHHAAFDRHLVWIDPASRSVVLSPDLIDQREVSEAASLFIRSTFQVLSEPREGGARPRAEMFEARYSHFATRYDWAI